MTENENKIKLRLNKQNGNDTFAFNLDNEGDVLNTQNPKSKPKLSRVLHRIWHDWLKEHKMRLGFIFVMMIIIAISSAGYARAVQWIISGLEARDPYIIYTGPFFVIILVMAKGGSQVAKDITSQILLSDIQFKLQDKMFNQLIDMDLSELVSESPSSQAARFSSDIEIAKQALIAIFSSVTAKYVNAVQNNGFCSQDGIYSVASVAST